MRMKEIKVKENGNNKSQKARCTVNLHWSVILFIMLNILKLGSWLDDNELVYKTV